MDLLRRLALMALLAVFSAPAAYAEADLPTEFESLTEAQQEEAVEFIIGNAIFVLFHEAGHMLISELGLPVLGKEEDAVDTLSAIILLEPKDEALDKALTDSADGWFLSDAAAQEAGADYAFWDEHSLDQQRAYAMVCMMVGQDAEGFKDFADSVDLPQDRREACAGEYESALESWNVLLEDALITDDSETKFDITYDDVQSGELAAYAELVKASDLLGILQEGIGKRYHLEPGIKLRATSCGEPNAFWDSQERQIIFCYELAQFHAGLLAKHFADEAAGAQ